MFSSLTSKVSQKWLTPASTFILSSMVVNAGNYAYNLVLGRTLGPAAFAEAGLILSLLLVLSLFGMSFQLTATRFIPTNGIDVPALKSWMQLGSLIIGIILSVIILLFQYQITSYFHLSTHWILVILAIVLPFYSLLSVQRGELQGLQAFRTLSLSYQKELWIKLLITFTLLMLFPQRSGQILAIAILTSIIAAIPTLNLKFQWGYPSLQTQHQVFRFFGFTMAYEFIQILINYGDLLMVKHYFDNQTAGLYTSMSLIGRMIYFITWMLVMVLIPRVIQLKKEGLVYQHLLLRNIGLVVGLALIIIFLTSLFPEISVKMLFGEQYLPIAPLLWKYALATSLFALTNLFIYYFISLDKYWPVLLAGVVAGLMLLGYETFHDGIEEIVAVQVLGMGILLVVVVTFSSKDLFKHRL